MPKRETIDKAVLDECIKEWKDGRHMSDIAVDHNIKYHPLRRALMQSGASDLVRRDRAVSSAEVDDCMRERRMRINELCDALLERLERYLDDDAYIKRNLRSLTAAIKDIKAVQGIVTDLDYKEQAARIKNLEKAFETDNAGVVIKIEGGADAWSQ